MNEETGKDVTEKLQNLGQYLQTVIENQNALIDRLGDVHKSKTNFKLKNRLGEFSVLFGLQSSQIQELGRSINSFLEVVNLEDDPVNPNSIGFLPNEVDKPTID